MTAFVVSKIFSHNRRLCEIGELYKIVLEKLLTFQSYYTVSKVSKSRLDDNDMLEILLKEPVELFISNFNIKSEIETYIHIIQAGTSKLLMISSPRGIGLSRKGSLRRYVDISLWHNLLGVILSEYGMKYSPILFTQDHLDFSKWGDELREIYINIHNFGKIKLTGKDIYSKSNVIDVDKLISIGEVSRIKVKSFSLKKVIDVRNNGVIKINEKNHLKVIKYLMNILEELL